MRSKIKTLKNIIEVKEVHGIIAEAFNEFLREGSAGNFNIADIYTQMVELMRAGEKLQLKVEVNKECVGAIVGYPNEYNEKEIYIKAILVRKAFQKQGLARKLLKKFEKNAKKRGFHVIKMFETDRINGFITRAGYIPYLYISTDNEEDYRKAKELAEARFSILEERIIGDSKVLKLDIEEEAVYKDKRRFYDISEDIYARFIYEKKIK